MSTTTIQNNAMPASVLAAMNPSAAAKAQSTAAAAQDRFMTLLVTQMKNQDPLNPLDNAQVTSQLAQLSTVTGIDKLNGTLESLKSNYQASQSLQAAGMIGHGVLVPGSAANLANGSALMGAELTEPADSVVINIRNAAGNILHSVNLGSQGVGTLGAQWDGKTDSGETAADGQYSFDVVATRGGKQISGVTPLTFGDVVSVSTNAQGVKLNVPGVGAVDMADVRQIL